MAASFGLGEQLSEAPGPERPVSEANRSGRPGPERPVSGANKSGTSRDVN